MHLIDLSDCGRARYRNEKVVHSYTKLGCFNIASYEREGINATHTYIAWLATWMDCSIERLHLQSVINAAKCDQCGDQHLVWLWQR